MKKLFCSFLLFLLLTTYYLLLPTPIHAIYDPLSVPNNKMGIHIISATPDEIKPASEMVNNQGDWGYITILIESKDRNENKWQEFFNELRIKHLIPLIRLSTKPTQDGYWERPYEGEEVAWADFLDKLNWPTKNRYIIVYNEPNHATEWGNSVDAKNYAQVLSKTISALKEKNEDFFILNAGLDASAPQKLPTYQDQISFMEEMNEEVPGVLERLDGWVSHPYPNPGFSGSPSDSGRITIRGYLWELDLLKRMGVEKNLPVFITETGWKHSNGKIINTSYPTPEEVGEYYRLAFNGAWNNDRIAAVTPFLLSYQDPPFDNFSFKKNPNQISVESESESDYHLPYFVLKDMSKIKGKPIQISKAELVSGEIYKTLVAGETYNIPLTFKNIGQSIWNDEENTRLVAIKGGEDLGIASVRIPKGVKVEPGQEYTFILNFKTPKSGTFNVALNLANGVTPFDSEAMEFETEIKSPVVLKIKAKLKWKDNSTGEYILTAISEIGSKVEKIILGKTGQSAEFEAKYLLPNYSYDLTLEKPFYKPKTIQATLKPGVNELDFGELQPDISSAILNPRVLWGLLPFSK